MEKKNVSDAYSNQMFTKRADSYEDEANWIKNEQFILPLVPSPYGTHKLLDACSGTGVIAKYCKKKGWNVTAVDTNEEMLKHVDAGIEKQVDNIEHLTFPDKYFDVSVCRQGLHYTDLFKSIPELIRVTKSEIRIAHITIMDKIDVNFWKRYYSIASPSRKHVFIPNQLDRLISDMGLKLINKEIITESDTLLGAIRYLDNLHQKELKEMIINSTIEFKDRNGITIDKEMITSNRRWEILTYVI